MKLDRQTHGVTMVLAAHGPLTGTEVGDFLHGVASAVREKSGRVVVDMWDIPYLDSEGIEALLQVAAPASSAGHRPRFARLTETCRVALDLTDALSQLDVYDTVESAIRSYAR